MKAVLINAIRKTDSFLDKETGVLINYDNYELHAIKNDENLGEICIVGTLKAKDAPAEISNLVGQEVSLDVLAKNGGRYKFESIERR